MTDERHRPRRHDISDQPTEQLDLDRLRYFTQPADGKPSTRHRRRREAGADGPPTGPHPAVPPPAAPEARTPTSPRGGSTDSWPAPPGRPAGRRQAPPHAPSPDVTSPPSRPERVMPRRIPAAPPPQEYVDDRDQSLTLRSGEYADPLRSAVPHRSRAGARAEVADTATAPVVDVDDDFVAADLDDDTVDERPSRRRRTKRRKPVTVPGEQRPASRRRTRRRIVLAVVLACMLALVAGVGFVGLRSLGVFENHKDYTDAAGTGDVIVDIPQDSTLMDFGRILERDDVVGSALAFVDAADGQAMSGGFYKLRTEIPAATAVEMMTDGTEHRVGRMVVPEGLQLDNKNGVDGKTTPGIFQMIADATAVTVNGQRIGADVPALEKAAADSSPEALGVPDWARPTVEKLTGDHRRIEGLIAPGTWETIDPTHSATQILHDLIVASAARFEQWGLLEQRDSGLSPYETLVAASLVEREVANPTDYAKVARVILNRLAKGQRLEMDSTANYTATVTNIDVYGDAYKADNDWNTYRIQGLPVTPIGAVGERALEAVEHPAEGDWLYFVTIDREGTTLFAATFDQHKQNREKACENKLLSTGCG